MHKALVAGTLEVEERVAQIEKYLNDLSLHHDSRRGLDGARGEQGLPGRDSTAVGPSGPAGRDGKDADITKTVELALKKVREEFDAEYKILAETVRHELKISGVIDENGVAIPGPAGRDSNIQGIPGVRGDTGAPGQNGRDAQVAIGTVSVGDQAAASIRVEDGVSYIDLVLPRAERGEKGETGTAGRDGADSTVQGPAGPEGREGQQGISGPGMSKSDIVNLILDMKKRGSI